MDPDEKNINKTKTYAELREQIAEMLFHQTTMEHNWEERKDWVKDTYYKDTDELFNVIKEAGWVLIPKGQSLNQG
ncbi:MAG: hypothetical protein WCA78_03290 [Rhizomicrobium sp.]